MILSSTVLCDTVQVTVVTGFGRPCLINDEQLGRKGSRRSIPGGASHLQAFLLPSRGLIIIVFPCSTVTEYYGIPSVLFAHKKHRPLTVDQTSRQSRGPCHISVSGLGSRTTLVALLIPPSTFLNLSSFLQSICETFSAGRVTCSLHSTFSFAKEATKNFFRD